MDCSLCDFKTLKKQKLFETKNEFVIYNKWAATKGQCMVVPKKHVQNIREMSDSELQSLIKTVQLVSDKLNSYLNPKGFNFGFNENKIAGQDINHLHFHIIPRYENDSISNNLLLPKPKTMKKLKDNKLNRTIEELKAQLESF